MIKSQTLIIGDIILDEYWFGDSNRISPEAPIPVVDINKKDFRIYLKYYSHIFYWKRLRC